MRRRQEAIDREIYSIVAHSTGVAVADLARLGIRIGTARASLRRLFEASAVIRDWDGNERFGRYLYRISPQGEEIAA